MKHPLPWYLERVGKRIKRAEGNIRPRDSRWKRDKGDGIFIHNKVFAEYLFELQEEQGYRYEEFNITTIPQTVLP